MFGAIVLRDIPKKEARIDLIRQPIEGGFRGFSEVPPAAWHYVSVLVGEHYQGFWCYLQPNQVIVKVLDQNQVFQEADAETQAQYASLALSGGMGPALIPYPPDRFGPWLGLVNHIPEAGFPPPLHTTDTGTGSRFDSAFMGTHEGDQASFLAEFQYAFVRWLVSLNMAAEDKAAGDRWRHLVLAAYNAGERRIKDAGELFPQLVDTLLRQFDTLPDNWFTGGSFLVSGQASYMTEDMIDTGIPALVEKGQAFATYLQRRSYG